MISKDVKKQVIEAVKVHAPNYTSGVRQAHFLGIHTSAHSRIMNGETEKVLSDAKWIAIARKYNVPIDGRDPMKTAKTATFNFIWQQLEFAQQNSVSAILCDRADIGKTHTAKAYAGSHKNVCYIDCGLYKSPRHFILGIAKGFGYPTDGLYQNVFADLIAFIKTIETPLVILDEFGDLNNKTYLEFKTIWNATDGCCAWYAMGADGLKVKLERLVQSKVIGFAEIKSRMGNKYQTISPETDADFSKWQRKQIAQIGTANDCDDAQALTKKTDLSLRRIPIQLGLEKKAKEQKAKNESNG